MYCIHCGAQNSPEATFCQQCGKQLPTTDQDEPTVSTNPPARSSPYAYTPYPTTPSPLPDTIFAPPPPPPPPPPPGVPKTASSSVLPSGTAIGDGG
jgi:hypothetical protein